MSCFLTNSSLGKKLVMSLTGCFLVLFILFHMSMNLVAIISPEGYNTICAFLGANWYALAGTVVLAAGVLIHFAYALWLTYNNYQARGKQRYEVTVTEPGVDWASKNMLVLGWIILAGLALHLFNFWAKMQLVEIMGGHENSLGFHPADGAALIQYTFSQWYYVVIYLLWFAALWFHLTHGVDVPVGGLGQRHVVPAPQRAGHRRRLDRIPRLRSSRRGLFRAEHLPLFGRCMLTFI
jgi:succinate dehydrogenase / fumarate reductase cytochrome b subunit